MSHKPIRLQFQVGAEKVTVRIESADRAEPDKRTLRELILDKATATPAPAKVLAKRCKRPYNPHFRQAVADLVRGGQLVRSPDGLTLPSDAGRTS